MQEVLRMSKEIVSEYATKIKGKYYDTDIALKECHNNMMNGGYTVRTQDMKKRLNKAFGKKRC